MKMVDACYLVLFKNRDQVTEDDMMYIYAGIIGNISTNKERKKQQDFGGLHGPAWEQLTNNSV